MTDVLFLVKYTVFELMQFVEMLIYVKECSMKLNRIKHLFLYFTTFAAFHVMSASAPN